MKIKDLSPKQVKDLDRHNGVVDRLIFALGDKTVKVAIYLLSHISPKTNIYRFTVMGMANKLNCSKQTVRKGIHLLQNNKYVLATFKYVRLRYDNGKLLHGTNDTPKIAKHIRTQIKEKQMKLSKEGGAQNE